MRGLTATCVLASLACFASAAFDMQASFDLVDANQDSYVSKAEFDGLYDTFDDNSDGELNATEFTSHFTKTGLSVQGSLYIFFRMDKNADVIVSTDEVNALFSTFDVNGDQSVEFQEYAAVMNAILEQLQRASASIPALTALFRAADVDQSSSLSAAEMPGLLAGTDQDGDKLVDKVEFANFWHSQTADSVRNGEAVFAVFDKDGDGTFGTATDQANFFDGFDYTNDQMVSEEEYLNGMLNVYAQAMNIVDGALVVSFTNQPTFDTNKLFEGLDTDMDGQISETEALTAFNGTDTNSDGTVNATEYVANRVKLGFSSKQALYMFFALDVNEDHMADISEARMSFHQSDRDDDQQLSLEEFNHALENIGFVMKEIINAAPKILAMLDLADLNGDDMLTREEMSSIFSPADTNMDGAVDSKEFLVFWTQHTGNSEEITVRLFNIVDGNQNDKIDDVEKTALFDGFDYGQDGLVSFEEFRNSLLFLYAKSVRALGRDIAGRLQGGFNITAAFAGFDVDHDGYLTMSESNFINQTDTDRDGKVSAIEFITAAKPLRLDTKGSLYLFFKYDANNDQFVDEKEVADSFAAVDTDDDNRISKQEYITSWTRILRELKDASIGGYRLSKTYDYTDYDHSGDLTANELKGLILYADKNKDGLIEESEFVSLWMEISGEPSNRASFIFDILDYDSDGYFGNDQELTALFDAFDYEDDDVITKDEFLNSCLNLYARAVREEIKMEKAAKIAAGAIGYFF